MPDDATMHLDRAYDNTPTRDLLDELGLHGEIARKGVPAPIQVGKRWVVERTNSWMNGYGKIRRCTERDAKIIDFCLCLAAAYGHVASRIGDALRECASGPELVGYGYPQDVDIAAEVAASDIGPVLDGERFRPVSCRV